MIHSTRCIRLSVALAGTMAGRACVGNGWARAFLGCNPGTPWSTRGASRHPLIPCNPCMQAHLCQKVYILSMQPCLPAKTSGSPAQRADQRACEEKQGSPILYFEALEQSLRYLQRLLHPFRHAL